ncbi:Cell adhesion molecule 2-like 3 [Homarus americanus]|uniref:Cell adhesion molecule 2-like 3 n=1 Tax=Homarus americanus TaxID=6706 RepID=A0A8J5KEQ8_HOMAM|nr:Cell adhesion molecule 2-like 3 [Homarus americanus]
MNVPPKQVDLSAWSNPDPLTYRSGDMVEINCTATGAKPKANIKWEINDLPVKERNLMKYSDFEDSRGRVTSKLGLRWRAPDYFRNNLARVTCIAMVGGHATRGSKNIYLDPASSAAFNHQFGAAGSQLPTTWTILSLASILIARSFP